MYNTIESEGEHMYNRILVFVLSLVLLCGCANRMAEDKDELCHIVIEEGEGSQLIAVSSQLNGAVAFACGCPRRKAIP